VEIDGALAFEKRAHVLFCDRFVLFVCDASSTYNESLYIGAAIYNVVCLLSFGIPLVATGVGGRTTTYLLRQLGLLVVVASTCSIVFLPKFWQLVREGRCCCGSKNGAAATNKGGKIGVHAAQVFPRPVLFGSSSLDQQMTKPTDGDGAFASAALEDGVFTQGGIAAAAAGRQQLTDGQVIEMTSPLSGNHGVVSGVVPGAVRSGGSVPDSILAGHPVYDSSVDVVSSDGRLSGAAVSDTSSAGGGGGGGGAAVWRDGEIKQLQAEVARLRNCLNQAGIDPNHMKSQQQQQPLPLQQQQGSPASATPQHGADLSSDDSSGGSGSPGMTSSEAAGSGDNSGSGSSDVVSGAGCARLEDASEVNKAGTGTLNGMQSVRLHISNEETVGAAGDNGAAASR
jgi:hypothetical protein